jgi:hypothetical protein
MYASSVVFDSRCNLQFAEYWCGKPDKRGNFWVYPVPKVADGKAKHATKADQKIASGWVERMLGKHVN